MTIIWAQKKRVRFLFGPYYVIIYNIINFIWSHRVLIKPPPYPCWKVRPYSWVDYSQSCWVAGASNGTMLHRVLYMPQIGLYHNVSEWNGITCLLGAMCFCEYLYIEHFSTPVACLPWRVWHIARRQSSGVAKRVLPRKGRGSSYNPCELLCDQQCSKQQIYVY